MKLKVWVLSTCIPSEAKPCIPEVFTSEKAAMQKFSAYMRDEWENNSETDDEGNSSPCPEDPYEAHEKMSKFGEWCGELWGKWEITTHVLELDLPALVNARLMEDENV